MVFRRTTLKRLIATLLLLAFIPNAVVGAFPTEALLIHDHHEHEDHLHVIAKIDSWHHGHYDHADDKSQVQSAKQTEFDVPADDEPSGILISLNRSSLATARTVSMSTPLLRSVPRGIVQMIVTEASVQVRLLGLDYALPPPLQSRSTSTATILIRNHAILL